MHLPSGRSCQNVNGNRFVCVLALTHDSNHPQHGRKAIRPVSTHLSVPCQLPPRVQLEVGLREEGDAEREVAHPQLAVELPLLTEVDQQRLRHLLRI